MIPGLSVTFSNVRDEVKNTFLVSQFFGVVNKKSTNSLWKNLRNVTARQRQYQEHWDTIFFLQLLAQQKLTPGVCLGTLISRHIILVLNKSFIALY